MAGDDNDKTGVIRNVTSVKSSLSKFTGTNGAVEFLLFRQQVDEFKTAGSLTEEATASAVAKVMDGKAKIWYDGLVLGGDKDILAWATLHPLMKGRFCKAPTISEQRKMMDELVQKATGESVVEFYDRVILTLHKCDIGLAEGTTKAAGYKDELQRRTRDRFLMGLRPAIRNALTGMAATSSTVKDLLTAAVNAEDVLNVNATQGNVETASTDEIGEVAEMLAEIANFNARWATKGYQVQPPKYNGPKTQCGRCKMWCNHSAADCRVNLERLAARQAGRGRGGGDGGRWNGGGRGRGGARGGPGGRGRGRGGGGAYPVDEANAEEADGFGYPLNE